MIRLRFRVISEGGAWLQLRCCLTAAGDTTGVADETQNLLTDGNTDKNTKGALDKRFISKQLR